MHTAAKSLNISCSARGDGSCSFSVVISLEPQLPRPTNLSPTYREPEPLATSASGPTQRLADRPRSALGHSRHSDHRADDFRSTPISRRSESASALRKRAIIGLTHRSKAYSTRSPRRRGRAWWGNGEAAFRHRHRSSTPIWSDAALRWFASFSPFRRCDRPGWSTSSPDRSSRPRVLRTPRLPPEGPPHRAADRSYCRHSRKNYTTARPCLDHPPRPAP